MTDPDDRPDALSGPADAESPPGVMPAAASAAGRPASGPGDGGSTAALERSGPEPPGPVPSGQNAADPGVSHPGVSGPRPSGSGTPRPAGSGWAADVPPAPTDAELVRLRTLLFSREIALIDSIRAALDNPRFTTGKVSEVLAEAVLVRSGKDPALAMALEPLVDGIVKTSLNTRRKDFIAALFPLMGPTIRKSIAEGFRSMLESFSKSLEMAFSWRGVKWRIEALRSGKPFSEIVMLNTLVYRVEQLFFIHSDTGLVLSHLTNESVESQDADMVSAMLTAIQDFVRDCFAGGREENLEALRMGEFSIHIEKAPQAYLACVVRGTPPAGFDAQLRATLELMLVEYADALDGFSGDNEPFVDAARFLEPCLLSHYADEDKPLPLWAKALPVLLLLLLLGGIGHAYDARLRSEAAQAEAQAAREAFTGTMRRAVAALRTEPGLMVVTVTEAREAPWELILMKDALARPAEAVLRENGFDPGLFALKTIPFISYDPSIVVRRVTEAIKPPETVSMRFDEKGVLSFSGTAPMSWIVTTRDEARAIPGVEHVDVRDVRDPMMEQIIAMVREIEDAVIEFPLGKDTPIPADLPKLKKAIDTLADLEKITKKWASPPP